MSSPPPSNRGRDDTQSPEGKKSTARRNLTPGRAARPEASPPREKAVLSPMDSPARTPQTPLTNLVTDRPTMITSKTRVAASGPTPVSASRVPSSFDGRGSARSRVSPQNSARSDAGAGDNAGSAAFAIPGKSHRGMAMPSRSKSSGPRGVHRRTPSAPAQLAHFSHGTIAPRSGTSKTKQRDPAKGIVSLAATAFAKWGYYLLATRAENGGPSDSEIVAGLPDVPGIEPELQDKVKMCIKRIAEGVDSKIPSADLPDIPGFKPEEQYFLKSAIHAMLTMRPKGNSHRDSTDHRQHKSRIPMATSTRMSPNLDDVSSARLSSAVSSSTASYSVASSPERPATATSGRIKSRPKDLRVNVLDDDSVDNVLNDIIAADKFCNGQIVAVDEGSATISSPGKARSGLVGSPKRGGAAAGAGSSSILLSSGTSTAGNASAVDNLGPSPRSIRSKTPTYKRNQKKLSLDLTGMSPTDPSASNTAGKSSGTRGSSGRSNASPPNSGLRKGSPPLSGSRQTAGTTSPPNASSVDMFEGSSSPATATDANGLKTPRGLTGTNLGRIPVHYAPGETELLEMVSTSRHASPGLDTPGVDGRDSSPAASPSSASRASPPHALLQPGSGKRANSEWTIQPAADGGKKTITGPVQNGDGMSESWVMDDFEKLGVLGHGAGGIVEKVLRKSTGEMMALKMMASKENTASEDDVLREINALCTTQNTHILTFYNAFAYRGLFYICLEFMDFGSLFDVLQQSSPPQSDSSGAETNKETHSVIVPENLLARIILQVVSGLLYLHKTCHRFHRDIKPHNVLCGGDGTIKIGDLGVVSQPLEGTLSEATTFCGTLLYMAPERLVGQKYSYSSDIWSLGITMYQCACGKVPYPQRNGFFNLLHDITHKPVPALDNVVHTPVLSECISACLQKEADRRPDAEMLKNHALFQPLLALPHQELVLPVKEFFTGCRAK